MIWIINHSDNPIDCPASDACTDPRGRIWPGTEHVDTAEGHVIRDRARED